MFLIYVFYIVISFFIDLFLISVNIYFISINEEYFYGFSLNYKQPDTIY